MSSKPYFQKSHRPSKRRSAPVISGAQIIEVPVPGVIRKESAQTKDPYQEQGYEDIVNPPYEMESLEYFYEQNVWHFRCCDVKAKSVCNLGWQIASEDGSAVNENAKDYKKLKEFLKRPNDKGQSLAWILYRVWIDFEAFGNAYIEVDLNNKGEIANIYHLPAYTVRISKDKNFFYQIRAGSKAVKFNYFYARKKEKGLNSVIHLKSYYPKSDYYGIPDFLPALSEIFLDINASEYNINFFQNSAIPAVAIVVEGGELSPDTLGIVKNFFADQVKGVSNSHKTLYIPIKNSSTKIRFEKLNEPIRDASFRNMRHDNRDAVVAAHGVPPRMVGIMSAGQLGGSSEAYAQMRQFREMVINPRQNDLEDELARAFQHGLGVNSLRVKFNELNIDDPKDTAERLKTLRDGGVLTEDEAREEIGKEPLKDNQNILTAGKLVEVLESLEKIIKAKDIL